MTKEAVSALRQRMIEDITVRIHQGGQEPGDVLRSIVFTLFPKSQWNSIRRLQAARAAYLPFEDLALNGVGPSRLLD